MADPYEIRNQAAQLVGEDRVPTDLLRSLLDGAGVNAAGDDPYLIRVEAERVIGEDRVDTDVLSDMIETYGQDEDADLDF